MQAHSKESLNQFLSAPDVIHRLQSMIIELERMTQSCLIVTHRVVMRILLGYLLDWTHDEMVNYMNVLMIVCLIRISRHILRF
jgi:broad specificity phosphatase PhoE